jgi:two-component system CheB/CheR fusion protein
MTIKPLPAKLGQQPLAAVLIEEMDLPQSREEGTETRIYDLDQETEQYMRDMEQELQFTRENLQATIEELETANEELQATNEELLASNEELQSTNEELQSANEELHTVNVEHQNKIIELTELNNDVHNLLANDAMTGKLLLDENLEIRRFSARIKSIFKIADADIGRPLSDLTHRILNTDPLAHVDKVIATQKPVEKEVQVEDGTWYLMRILPYQIGAEVYAGAVLSFVDLTAQKQTESNLQISESEKALILDNISEAITHLDLRRRIKWLNVAAAELMGGRPEDLIGRHCHTAWGRDGANCSSCPFQQVLENGSAAQGTVSDARGRRWHVRANPVRNAEKKLVGVIEMRHPVG